MPSTPTLQQLNSSIQSGTLHSTVNNLAAGGSYIQYVTGADHSAFIAAASQNGIVSGGIIRINTTEVQATANKQHISYDDALKEVVVHEVGHGANATTDAHNIAVTPAALENYCYTREGEAASFGFQVAMEDHQAGGSLQVAGVTASPDLYYNLLATYTALSATMDPRSTVFQNNMVSYATAQFASDPNYQAACKAYAANPSKAALFLAPDDYAPSGESGSADGGNYTDPDGDYSDYPGYGDNPGGDEGGGDDGGGGGDEGGGGGCVSIDAILPDGGLAGEIAVGDEMQLADERTLEPGRGVVSYSQIKTAVGFRITTASGVSLKCSDTAPIPTPEGLVLAPDLLGKRVAVRKDSGAQSSTSWEVVTSVELIGEIQVQHITVGDKCFWAGEHAGAYILHHNLKDAGGGGGGGEDPGDDDWMTAQLPGKSSKVASSEKAAAQQQAVHTETAHTGATAPETQHMAAVEVKLVGQPDAHVHHVMGHMLL